LARVVTIRYLRPSGKDTVVKNWAASSRPWVLQGRGRHGDPRVVGEQSDDAVHIAFFEGAGEAGDELSFVGGAGRWGWLVSRRGGQSLEGGARV